MLYTTLKVNYASVPSSGGGALQAAFFRFAGLPFNLNASPFGRLSPMRACVAFAARAMTAKSSRSGGTTGATLDRQYGRRWHIQMRCPSVSDQAHMTLSQRAATGPRPPACAPSHRLPTPPPAQVSSPLSSLSSLIVSPCCPPAGIPMRCRQAFAAWFTSR